MRLLFKSIGFLLHQRRQSMREVQFLQSSSLQQHRGRQLQMFCPASSFRNTSYPGEDFFRSAPLQCRSTLTVCYDDDSARVILTIIFIEFVSFSHSFIVIVIRRDYRCQKNVLLSDEHTHSHGSLHRLRHSSVPLAGSTVGIFFLLMFTF